MNVSVDITYLSVLTHVQALFFVAGVCFVSETICLFLSVSFQIIVTVTSSVVLSL